ncbi:unnamed protein product [Camellia sinensis]
MHIHFAILTHPLSLSFSVAAKMTVSRAYVSRVYTIMIIILVIVATAKPLLGYRTMKDPVSPPGPSSCTYVPGPPGNGCRHV